MDWSAGLWGSIRNKEIAIHEAGIASNIIQIAESRAKENQLDCILKLELEIGALSGVQIDALQFALDALKPPTMLSQAEFIFTTPLLLLFCRGCENEYVAQMDDLICPGCMNSDFEIKQGNELKITSIQGMRQPGQENSV